MKQKIPKGYCNIREAVNHTGIPRAVLEKEVDRGTIQSIPFGNSRLVDAVSVVEYMKKNELRFPGDKRNNKNEHIYAHTKARERTCAACDKPFTGRQRLCRSCSARQKKIGEWRASVKTVLEIKRRYPGKNPFDIIESDQTALYSAKHGLADVKPQPAKGKKAHRNGRLLSYTSRTASPVFVVDYFNFDESKELLYVIGNSADLDVHFVCKRCGKEQCQKFSELSKGAGHNCDAAKSSGEAIVESYLKSRNVKFLTQRETLKCVNPDTGFVMPYDFELPGKKVIIEVQGNQHYKYIPFFHGTEESFHASVARDEYKKQFAESAGYKVLYLTYEDIESGAYKEALDSL